MLKYVSALRYGYWRSWPGVANGSLPVTAYAVLAALIMLPLAPGWSAPALAQAGAEPIRYPAYIEERRQQIAADTAEVYLAEPDKWGDSLEDYSRLYSSETEPVRHLAAKIVRREPVTDEDIAPVRERINQRLGIRDLTFLYLALRRYNVQAIDMLLKNGADPCKPGIANAVVQHGNFLYPVIDEQGDLHPGLAAEIAKVYARRGRDPNCFETRFGTTFTYAMVIKQNEPAWTVLIEAGGDPWRRDGIDHWSDKPIVNELSAAATAARRDYFPFLDYLVAHGYFVTARAQDVDAVLAEIMAKPSRDDERARHRKRIVRAILAAAGRQPDEKTARYLAYTLPVPPPAYPLDAASRAEKSPLFQRWMEKSGLAGNKQPAVAWSRRRDPEGGAIRAGWFKPAGEDFYRLALKIGRYEPLTEADAAPLKGRLDERYQDITLLGHANRQYNREAVDFLFRHGADPYVRYAAPTSPDRTKGTSFSRDMVDSFSPEFVSEAVWLYARHGFDPNYVVDEDGTTLLEKMVMMDNVPAWTALIEAGGNPWARSSSISIHNATTWVFNQLQTTEFVDYLLQHGYFARARPEDVRLTLKDLTRSPPINNGLLEMRLRLFREIRDASGLALNDAEQTFLDEAEKALAAPPLE